MGKALLFLRQSGYRNMTIQLTRIKYDVISEPLHGQIVCGDQYLIKECDDTILLAVIDGLGHGEEAYFAAKMTIKTLEEHCSEPLEALVILCNQSLLNMRGVAMTIGKIDLNNTFHYVGIGNISGLCWKRDENFRLIQQSLLTYNGIVGAHLPSSLQIQKINLSSGDVIILTTDGIKNKFEDETPTLILTEEIAKNIFNNYGSESDDKLVLVAKLL